MAAAATWPGGQVGPAVRGRARKRPLGHQLLDIAAQKV